MPARQALRSPRSPRRSASRGSVPAARQSDPEGARPRRDYTYTQQVDGGILVDGTATITRAGVPGPRLVALAMGPLGVASRILGGRYGAPFTFASAENGREAAPGTRRSAAPSPATSGCS